MAQPKKYRTNIADLISASIPLQKPGPTKYNKLVTNVRSLDNEEKLKRVSFGSQNLNVPHKTILMIGETGTGKTNMINTMVNYVLGVELEDEVWFEIVEEVHRYDQTISQTSEITVYDIFGHERCRVPYSLSIIDTPGYGDTRGIHKDKRVAEKCLELFRSPNGIKEIDVVAFVVKASENRLSDRQHYLFDAILSLFGKDLESNFVYFFTHSTGYIPENALQALKTAKVPCATDYKKQPIYFLFDNQKAINTTGMSSRMADQTKDSMQSSWKRTRYSMEDFSEFLKTVKTQNVKMSEGVLRERKQLEANIRNLREKIIFIEEKQVELKMYDEVVQRAKEKMVDATHEITVKRVKKVFEDVDHWTTSCKDCQENCHTECWWVTDLSWCSVMKKDKCTVCTGGCHHERHEQKKKKYVMKKENVKMTKTDVKEKLKLEGIVGSNSEIATQLKEKLVMDEKDIETLLEKSYNCIVQLDRIALKTTSMSMVEPLDFLIERMVKKEDIEKVQELKDFKKRSEVINESGLTYFSRGLNKIKETFS